MSDEKNSDEKHDDGIKIVILDAFNDENGTKTVFLRGVFDEEIRIDKSRFAPNVVVKRIRANIVAPTPIPTFRVVGDQYEQIKLIATEKKLLENEKEGLVLRNAQLKKQIDAAQEDYRLFTIKHEKILKESKEKSNELDSLRDSFTELKQSEEMLKNEAGIHKTQLTQIKDENDTNIKLLAAEKELKEAHKAERVKLMHGNEELRVGSAKMKAENEKMREEINNLAAKSPPSKK